MQTELDRRRHMTVSQLADEELFPVGAIIEAVSKEGDVFRFQIRTYVRTHSILCGVIQDSKNLNQNGKTIMINPILMKALEIVEVPPDNCNDAQHKIRSPNKKHVEERIAKAITEMERRKIPSGCTVSKDGQMLFMHMSKCNNPQDVHWGENGEIIVYNSVCIYAPYSEDSVLFIGDPSNHNAKEKRQASNSVTHIAAQVKKYYEKQARLGTEK